MSLALDFYTSLAELLAGAVSNPMSDVYRQRGPGTSGHGRPEARDRHTAPEPKLPVCTAHTKCPSLLLLYRTNCRISMKQDLPMLFLYTSMTAEQGKQ